MRSRAGLCAGRDGKNKRNGFTFIYLLRMAQIIGISILAILYLSINLVVVRRINESRFYSDEERRKLHKKFIWMIPFVGPLMVRGYWRKKSKNQN